MIGRDWLVLSLLTILRSSHFLSRVLLGAFDGNREIQAGFPRLVMSVNLNFGRRRNERLDAERKGVRPIEGRKRGECCGGRTCSTSRAYGYLLASLYIACDAALLFQTCPRCSLCEVHDPAGEAGAEIRHVWIGQRGTGNAAKEARSRLGANGTNKASFLKSGVSASIYID